MSKLLPASLHTRPNRTLRGWIIRGVVGAVVLGVVVWLARDLIHHPARPGRPPRTASRPTTEPPARAPAILAAEAVGNLSDGGATGNAWKVIQPSVALLEADGPRGLVPIGTAFVVAADGLVATNYHVTAEATQAVARFQDGSVYEVEGYAALDRENDLAILKLRSARGLIPATLQTKIPDPLSAVVAIGHPRGVAFSPYDGKLSRVVATSELPESIERFVRELTGSQREHQWLQHTASLSDGNSGGPLVDSEGRVIGMNAWVDRQSGFSYALPAAEILALRSRSGPEVEPLEHHATSDARLRAIVWQISSQQLGQLHEDAKAMRWQPANRGDYAKLQELAWGVTLANQPHLVGGAGALGERHAELVKTADQITAQLRQERWDDIGQITLLNEFAASQIARPAAGVMFFGTVERIVDGRMGQRAAIVRLAGFAQRMIVPLERGLSAPGSGGQYLFVGVNDRGRTLQYGDNPLQPIVAPVIIAPVVIELDG